MSIQKNEQIYRNNTEIKINQADSGSGTDTRLPNPFEIAPDTTGTAVTLAPNEVDNSDFSYSTDSYKNAVPVGGDKSFESYNWFRQRFFKLNDATVPAASSALTSAAGKFLAAYSYPMNFVLLGAGASGAALSGTLTRVSDTQATLSTLAILPITNGVLWFGEQLAESPEKALKATGHSLFAANEAATDIIPRWDTSGGWCEIGSNTADEFSLACPLPSNLARPGLSFFVSVILARRAGTPPNPNPLKLSAGVWDETASQKRFLEAANIVLKVVTVGAAGATVYNYKIIAKTDSGLRIESQIFNLTTGNAALSANNYNRLTWENVRGILDFEIERETGGVYKKIFTIQNGSTSYNDTGNYDEGTLPGFTSIGVTRAIAYAEKTFTLGGESSWFVVRLKIDVPSTYNSGATTGIQWLILGITGAATAARQILLDRVLMSKSDGGWDLSGRDKTLVANRVPSVNPVGSDQGSVGITYCLTGQMPIITGDADGSNLKKTLMQDVEVGAFADDGARSMTRLLQMSKATVSHYFEVYLSNRIRVDCTETERFITSRADITGTMLQNLCEGDEVLTKFIYLDDAGRVIRRRIETARIAAIVRIDEETEVYTPHLRHAKTFVAGVYLEDKIMCGAILHNYKQETDSNPNYYA